MAPNYTNAKISTLLPGEEFVDPSALNRNTLIVETITNEGIRAFNTGTGRGQNFPGDKIVSKYTGA